MPKRKKFIDKKKAVTFNVVHRSQRDPLAADESAPQRVLVPVNAIKPPKKEKEPELTPEQRKEEQRKYGVYFDDDYNYLQHLKDTREVTLLLQPKPVHKKKDKSQKNVDEEMDLADTLKLPSSVFASEVEEEVGLLNKAAPQGLCLDLDPEVVAALDEDFNFDDPENQLEDNFIELAMAEGSDEEEEESDDEESDNDMEGDDEFDGETYSDDDSEKAVASDLDSDDSSKDGRQKMPSWGETKSRFSQLSMSSSVIRRNEGLTFLDRQFDKMLAEYDDTELGALDSEEIEGSMPNSHDMLLKAAMEFEESKKQLHLDKDEELVRIHRLRDISEESEEEYVEVEMTPRLKYDCKSILSTCSNFSYQPALIEDPKKPKKIRINPRTGIPRDTLGKDNKLTAKALARFNAMNEQKDERADNDTVTNAETMMSTLSLLSIRSKNETPEQRSERKRELKEYRKERRIEKKDNKIAHKEEKKILDKLKRTSNVRVRKIL